MKYLILGVCAGECGPFTVSREMNLGLDDPKDHKKKIIEYIISEGISGKNLWEIFVFKSASNYDESPKLVARWDYDDI